MNRKRLNAMRERRGLRALGHVRGTPERPRLTLSRTGRNLYAQLVDDAAGRTLAALGTLDKEFRAEFPYGGNVKAAAALGTRLAAVAREKGVQQAFFDKSWYRYHGRVKAFADAARKAGLKF